jgi:polyphosphate glucokinase
VDAFGIDIGGSGVKGAPVDLDTGEFAAERHRIPTPLPATPDAVAAVVAEVVGHFGWSGDIGCTFPAVIQRGVARTAANVDPAWIGTDVEAVIGAATGRSVHAVNDADAAGVAEARFGAARGRSGVVVMTTLGTGIGTALLVDGVLVPNTELGHLVVDNAEAEEQASDAAREREDLDWPQWAARLERYYRELERLLWPDLFVIGGGVSKKSERFLPHIDIRTPIVAAQLRNSAGIVGAALLCAERGGVGVSRG